MDGRRESRTSRFLFKDIHNQRVYQGDCIEILKTFPDGSLDICVTSPPYNIGIKYNQYEDNKTKEEYLDWLWAVFAQVKRTLRPAGSLFLNVGSTSSNPWNASDVAQRLRELFVLQNEIIWVKSISIGDETHGHFKPINSQRYLNRTFENIYHFTKAGDVPIARLAIGVPYMDKGNLRRNKSGNDLRCGGNCWFIPYQTIRSKDERGDHPAVFPEELAERCIRLAGFNKDTVVCDPFSGTGTTLAVCKRLGIKGVGIEMDSGYFERSCQRLLKEA